MATIRRFGMHGLLTLISVAIFFFPVHAAADAQSWTQFLAQAKLTPHLRLWAEVQPRYSLDSGNFTTVLIRPGIGWQFTPEFSLWTGYAWTPLISPTPRNENRLWVQGMYVANLDPVTFTQRLRIETRFIENMSDPGLRLRYQARLALPVALDKALQLVTYDELFISVNSPAPSIGSGFDQNRFFVGGLYRFSSQLAFDLGYLWNVVRNSQLATTKSNHVLMASLYLSFDFASESRD